MKPWCDLHTHTSYCDGSHSAEDMLKGAIKAGCKTYGFSGHSPLDLGEDWYMSPEGMKEYVAETRALREKYRDQIEVYTGIEYDYMSDIDVSDFDYVIGSVHQIEKGGVIFATDITAAELVRYMNELYGGDALALTRDYYEYMYTLCEKTSCDIIGHFDLIMKFNERGDIFDFTDRRYRHTALEALEYLLSKDKIFEINTGGISRGYRTKPYPDDFILRYIAEHGGRVILSSDAHSPENIMFGFDAAGEFARSCGVRELTVMQNGKFEQIGI